MDHASPEERQRYRQELGTVARGWRWTGLSMVVVACVGLFLSRRSDAIPTAPGLQGALLALLGVGWVIALIGTWKRTAFHRARMRESGPPR